MDGYLLGKWAGPVETLPHLPENASPQCAWGWGRVQPLPWPPELFRPHIMEGREGSLVDYAPDNLRPLELFAWHTYDTATNTLLFSQRHLCI